MNRSVIQNVFVLLLFIIIGTLVYANTLETPFVFDDKPRIKANPYICINELTLDNLVKAVFNKKSSSKRPVGNLTFALNYYFHQYKLPGYHIVNISIHILSALFLYLFIKTTLSTPLLAEKYNRSDAIAFWAALIWLVHPLQTQSVTYIVQRLNSMAAMFYMLSLWLYVKGRLVEAGRKSWPWFTGSVIAGILAMGSKQNAAMLPFFVFLYEWYFFQDLDRDWLKRNMKIIFGAVVLFGLTALIFLGTSPLEKLKSISDFAKHEFTFTERVLTQPRVVMYYLSLVLLPRPSRLNLDYDFPLSHSLIDPVTTLFSIIVIIGLIGLAVYIARKERLLSFCILWFFGNLAIESSVIPLAIIFEHRTYLPSMLICLLAVTVGYRLIKLKWLGVTLIITVVAVFSFWTYQRNKVWRDDITLWQDVVNKSPKKARPHFNLGASLSRQAYTEKAIEHYLKALRIKPDYGEVYNNLGNDLDKLGRTQEAVQQYLQALKIKPDYEEAHNNLGLALEKLGHIDKAIKHYLVATRIKPDFYEAHNNLGAALEKQGDIDKAIEHYWKALRINPEFAGAHNNLAKALLKQGKLGEAFRHFHEALRINPEFVEAYNSLGAALIQTKKVDDAILNFKKALQIDPDFAETHVNLGGALIYMERFDEAIVHFRKALQIKPDLPEVHVNLGVALANKGKVEEAMVHFRKALQIDPDNHAARDNLNQTLATLEKIDGEIAYIQEQLVISPQDPMLNYSLGNMYRMKGQLDKAQDYYTKALSLQPELPEALYELAKLHISQGEYKKALELYHKMIAFIPDNPVGYYNIACIYARLNRPAESVVWLKKAVAKGLDDWNHIKTDKDLENIKGSPQYKEFIKGR